MPCYEDKTNLLTNSENVVILGTYGSGKTVLTKKLLTEMKPLQNTNIYVIGQEDEYADQDNYRFLFKYDSFDVLLDEYLFGFLNNNQILKFYADILEPYCVEVELSDHLVTFFSLLSDFVYPSSHFGITPAERSIIHCCARKICQHLNKDYTQVLISTLESLKKQQDLFSPQAVKKLLQILNEGLEQCLTFSRKVFKDKNERKEWTIYNTKEVPTVFLNIMIFLSCCKIHENAISNYLNQKRTILVLEGDCERLWKNEDLSYFINTMAKRARPFNMCMVFVLDDVGDLKRIGSSSLQIFKVISHFFFLNQTTIDVYALQDLFGLEEDSLCFLKKQKPGGGYLLESSSGIIQKLKII